MIFSSSTRTNLSVYLFIFLVVNRVHFQFKDSCLSQILQNSLFFSNIAIPVFFSSFFPGTLNRIISKTIYSPYTLTVLSYFYFFVSKYCILRESPSVVFQFSNSLFNSYPEFVPFTDFLKKSSQYNTPFEHFLISLLY